MIHVIATISLTPGSRPEFFDLFKANIPAVLAEDGCLAYELAVDAPLEGEPQEDLAIVIEKWQSHAHLGAHLEAPHMVAFRENAGHLVADVALAIAKPA